MNHEPQPLPVLPDPPTPEALIAGTPQAVEAAHRVYNSKRRVTAWAAGAMVLGWVFGATMIGVAITVTRGKDEPAVATKVSGVHIYGNPATAIGITFMVMRHRACPVVVERALIQDVSKPPEAPMTDVIEIPLSNFNVLPLSLNVEHRVEIVLTVPPNAPPGPYLPEVRLTDRCPLIPFSWTIHSAPREVVYDPIVYPIQPHASPIVASPPPSR